MVRFATIAKADGQYWEIVPRGVFVEFLVEIPKYFPRCAAILFALCAFILSSNELFVVIYAYEWAA